MREIIALYTQAESRDELGIGQVRDTFSEGLFPGTSVVQTRARYLLFVPWTYRAGAVRRSGAALKAWSDDQERALILALRDRVGVGSGEGLIGRVAGRRLKNLPSAIYWSGLLRYGILAHDVAPDQLGLAQGGQAEDELADRATSDWHPTLPAAPTGFPRGVDGLDLTRPEAEWLLERTVAATEGSLLAHLLMRGERLAADSELPWLDPACATASGGTRQLLHHGMLFSTAMHGAALAYNLLLAEAYDRAGHQAQPGTVERYEQAYREWVDDCGSYRGQLEAWDRADFWHHVLLANPRIGGATRQFVDAWLDAVVRGTALVATPPADLRMLVSTRERRQKRQQSRLENARLLRTWSGASGTRRLDYRWGTVRRLVLDVQEGLERAGT